MKNDGKYDKKSESETNISNYKLPWAYIKYSYLAYYSQGECERFLC